MMLTRNARRSEARRRRQPIRVGGWTIDPMGYTLMRGGEPVWLSLKEFALLLFLASHPDRVFTRSELLKEIWRSEPYSGTRIVDLHVRRLRRKLERQGGLLIRSVGVGRYQLAGYELLEEVQ